MLVDNCLLCKSKEWTTVSDKGVNVHIAVYMDGNYCYKFVTVPQHFSSNNNAIYTSPHLFHIPLPAYSTAAVLLLYNAGTSNSQLKCWRPRKKTNTKVYVVITNTHTHTHLQRQARHLGFFMDHLQDTTKWPCDSFKHALRFDLCTYMFGGWINSFSWNSLRLSSYFVKGLL